MYCSISVSQRCTSFDVDVVEVTVGAGVNADDLLSHAHGLILWLFQQLDHPVTAIEFRLRGWVQVSTQLCESFQSSESCQLETQSTGDFFIALVWASPPTRETLIPGFMGGTDAREEQVRLNVNLAVCDRNHVGWDIG